MFAPLQWAGVHPVVVYNLALAAGIIFPASASRCCSSS